jgi:hypothetical protein
VGFGTLVQFFFTLQWQCGHETLTEIFPVADIASKRLVRSLLAVSGF